jgi:hypothetical protein
MISGTESNLVSSLIDYDAIHQYVMVFWKNSRNTFPLG